MIASEIKQKILLEKNNKNYKKIFLFFNQLNEKNRNNIKYIENEIYYDIVKTLQELNLEGNIKEVERIYNEVYNFIPSKEQKIKNILLNEYEIANKKIILKSYPRILQVFVTNKCNLRCFMCDENNHNSNYEISDKNLELSLEIIPYLQYLLIRGGEIFLSKKTNIIIDKAINENVDIEIITNGLLLKEDILKKILDKNINLMISIDSQNKENYESIRGLGNFDKLLQVLELIKKLRTKNSKCILTLNMVVMKRNYTEIEKMLEFACKYGFDKVTLNSIAGSFPDENIFENIKYEKIVEELNSKKDYFDRLAHKYSIQLVNRLSMVNKNINHIDAFKINNSTSDKENSKNLFCLSPFRECYFSMNGFCPQIECKRKLKNENINSFFDFWNGNFMLEYRKKIICKQYMEICSDKCLNNESIRIEHNKIIYNI